MALHKALTTVTTLSKTLALVLFIALPFISFWLGIHYQKTLDIPFMNMSVLQTLGTPTPQAAEKDSCVQANEKNVYIETLNGKRIFHEIEHGYTMDVTLLPDLKTPTLADNVCLNTSFEMDMYPLREGSGKIPKGSVARVRVSAPVASGGVSLEEYARKNLSYVEGEHSGTDNYGQPFTSSPIVTVVSTNQAVAWSNIYTTEPQPTQDATATKEYLVEKQGMIVHFVVIAWDTPTFNKAVVDFDEVLKTFDF